MDLKDRLEDSRYTSKKSLQLNSRQNALSSFHSQSRLEELENIEAQPIKVIFEMDKLKVSESEELPDMLVGECISLYLQFFNVVVKKGKCKGKTLDKTTHSKPISYFAICGELHLGF